MFARKHISEENGNFKVMTKKLFAAVSTLLLGLSIITTPAKADFISGDQLRLYCTSQDPNDDAICVVYITGVFDALTSMDQLARSTAGAAPQFCPGDNVGPDELKEVSLAYLQRPDAQLDFGASLLVWGAMQNEYGCK